MSTMYSAAVEVAIKDHDDNMIDRLMGALSEYHVALGDSARGWLEARISLPAASLAQAAGSAIAVVSQATGGEAVACEVMTEQEFDLRNGFVPMPELLGSTEVAELLGISPQRVQQLVKARRLQAVPVGKSLVFSRAAVDAFAAKDRAPGRPARQ